MTYRSILESFDDYLESVTPLDLDSQVAQAIMPRFNLNRRQFLVLPLHYTELLFNMRTALYSSYLPSSRFDYVAYEKFCIKLQTSTSWRTKLSPKLKREYLLFHKDQCRNCFLSEEEDKELFRIGWKRPAPLFDTPLPVGFRSFRCFYYRPLGQTAYCYFLKNDGRYCALHGSYFDSGWDYMGDFSGLVKFAKELLQK